MKLFGGARRKSETPGKQDSTGAAAAAPAPTQSAPAPVISTSSSGAVSEVFLSVHVATLGGAAKQLKQAIEAQGRSVFLCTDISGGLGFRDEIIKAVKACKVFIPLMNSQWASSGECEDEFLLAKRLHLTSHERKATSPPNARRPIILPVAFPNLNPWMQFPHVELLAASVNFVLAPTDGSLDERMLSMISNMACKLCSDTTDVNSLIVTHGDAAQVNFGSLRTALDALDVYLAQATTILAGANALSSRKPLITGSAERTLFPPPRSKYIGFTYGRVSPSVETVFSLELHVVVQGDSSQRSAAVNGSVFYKVCSVTVLPGMTPDGELGAKLLALPEDAYAEIEIRGSYSFEHGLLRLEDSLVKHDATGFTHMSGWTPDAYRLLVSPVDAKELTGTLRGWSGEWDIAFRAEAF